MPFIFVIVFDSETNRGIAQLGIAIAATISTGEVDNCWPIASCQNACPRTVLEGNQVDALGAKADFFP